MNNIIKTQTQSNLLNLIFSILIILIIIAMIILGIKKRKIKNEIILLESQNKISNRHKELLKIRKKLNIALIVLGSILAILVITIFVTESIELSKRINEMNNDNSSGVKRWN